MPIFLLGGGPERSSLPFESRVRLRPTPASFGFASVVRPVERAPFAFASLIRLQRRAQGVVFRSFVALRPAPGQTVGQAPPPAALPTPAPVQIIPGAAPQRWALSCPLGRAISANYQHEGDSETATLTLRGEHRAGGTLAVQAALGEAPALARELAVDTRQYEITRSREEGTTTVLRLYNVAAERARSFALPELVGWVSAPRLNYPDGQGPPLRELGVSDLVRRAFAAAGLAFSLIGPDPYAGETWQETRRDTSTAGRTPADVFGDVYGALGYSLLVRGSGLYGVPPGGSLSGGGEAFTRCEIESLTERGEAGQVPSLIRLSAAERVVRGPLAGRGDQGEGGTAEPDEGGEQSAEDRAASWLTITPTDQGLAVDAGYVFGGRLRETQQVEIGRVEVREDVEGVQEERVFERVLIADTRTRFWYHPDCPEAVVRQETVKRGYAYGLGTQPRMVGVLGQMFGASLPGGDLVENQTDTVTQGWYEHGQDAGYLNWRRTEGQRLISLEQRNPDDLPERRGPIEGREYVQEVQAEIYRRVGRLWNRYYATTGGAAVPLYDQGSEEAVRLTVRMGAQQTGSETMRNEPPRVEWPAEQAAPEGSDGEGEAGGPADSADADPNGAPDRAELNVPQRAAFAVEGGAGGRVEQGFPMLATPAKLPAFAALIAHAAGPRVVQEASLTAPRGLLPGSEISSPVSGVVESLSIRIEGGKGGATLRAVSRTPPPLSPVPWPPDNNRRRGFVVAVQGRRVTVDVPEGGRLSAALLPGFAEPAVGSVVEVALTGGRAVIA